MELEIDYSGYLKDNHKPHARTIKELYPDACKDLIEPPEAFKLKSFPTLTMMTGGFRAREFSILCGSTGCLSGDTKISINRAGKGGSITIRDLYLRTIGIAKNKNFDQSIPTYVRSYNNINVGLNKIKNVFLSGIKETWRFKFSDMSVLRATPDHKFLTMRGWVPGSQLTKDDKIASDNKYASKSNRPSKKLYDTYINNLKYHPYATSLKRLVIHRAVYEANDNSLSLNEFIEICRNNESKAKTLRFVNPNTHHIHHINHDHYDNNISNLISIKIEDHLKIHSNNDNFHQGRLSWISLVSMDLPGVESVYDIECEEPFHNFAANNIIVHNSGKTTLVSCISADLLEQGIPHFVASVETGYTDYIRRMISVRAREDLNTGDPVPREKMIDFHVKHGSAFNTDNLYLSLYEDRFSVRTLMADIAYYVKHSGIKLAIVDNINFFLDVTAAKESIVEMDRVIHELIVFCKVVPVHIIMIMHPRKTESGRVDNMFDIKGSSTAIQEAQNVFLFNRAHPSLVSDGQADDSCRELKISKMRRRGKHVGRSLLLRSPDCVRYVEDRIW